MLRLSPIAAVALALAASAIAAPPQLTRDQANAAVQEVIRLVEAHYVFPEKRPAIAGASGMRWSPARVALRDHRRRSASPWRG